MMPGWLSILFLLGFGSGILAVAYNGWRSGELPAGGEIVFTGARAGQFGNDPSPGGKGAIRFFPDGAATGGRVRMVVNGGGWDVDVGWLTGDVRVSRVQESAR